MQATSPEPRSLTNARRRALSPRRAAAVTGSGLIALSAVRTQLP
jgi:hypothetical protein